MKKLSGIGSFIYGAVMVVAVVADVALLIVCFRKSAGLGLIYLFVGTWLFLTVAHWIGLALASPFVLAGAAVENRKASNRLAAAGSRTSSERSASERIASAAATLDSYCEDGWPWGWGWLQGVVLDSYEGGVTTGETGLALISNDGEEGQRLQFTFPWSTVEPMWFESLESLSVDVRSAHSEVLASSEGVVLSGFLTDPGSGMRGAWSVAIAISREFAPTTWKAPLDAHGVRYEDRTDKLQRSAGDPPGSREVLDGDGAQASRPAAPGWRQADDGTWLPPAGDDDQSDEP
jgi:hypothetical protein